MVPYFLQFPLYSNIGVNALTLNGQNCTSTQLSSVNGLYSFEGYINGAPQFSNANLGVSSTGGAICIGPTVYTSTTNKYFIRKNSANLWEVGIYTQPANFFVPIGSAQPGQFDRYPKCGIGFGGTVDGGSCYECLFSDGNIAIIGGGNYCQNSSVTLTALGCHGVVTWDNGTTGSTNTVTASGVKNIAAYCSTKNICYGVTSVTATPLPAPPIITTNPTLDPIEAYFCKGSSLTLTANCGSSTPSWITPASGGATVTDTPILTNTGSKTYTAKCTDNLGCMSQTGLPIGIKDVPTITQQSGTSGVTLWHNTLQPMQWVKDGVPIEGAHQSFIVPEAGIYTAAVLGNAKWSRGKRRVDSTLIKSICAKEEYNPGSGSGYFEINGWLIDEVGIYYFNELVDGTYSEEGKTKKLTASGLNAIVITGGSYIANTMAGIAVGNGGIIYRTTNSGTTWNTVSSGTSNHLLDISFVPNSGTGWAVGTNNTILKTTNGGVSWTAQGTAGNINQTYTKVFVVSTQSVTIIAWDEVNGIGKVMNTSNGGSTWTTLFSQVGTRINSFASIAGKYYIYGKTNTGSVILHSQNSGLTWLPFNYSPPELEAGVDTHFYTYNYGFILHSTSNLNIYSTIDGGTTYRPEFSESGIIGIDLFMLSTRNRGWAVGQDRITDKGAIFRYKPYPQCYSQPITICTTSPPAITPSGNQSICFPATSLLLTANGCSTGTVTWNTLPVSTGATLSISQAGTYKATCTTTCGVSPYSTSTVVSKFLFNGSLSSGVWSSPARWSCGHIPLATEPVQISSGHTITLDVNGTAKSLDLRGILNKQATKVLQIQGN